MTDSGEDVPTALNVQFDVVDNRQVIRRASLQLHASDTRAAFDEIIRLTEIAGGFVANANVFPFQSEDAQPEVSITVRIPAGQLNSTMNAIKKSVDEVVSESQSAQDVTEQFGGILGLPTTFMVGRDGKYYSMHRGLVSRDIIEDDLLALLNEAPAE